MKNIKTIGTAFLLAALLATAPAIAGPGYSARDLSGEYLIILAEVRYEDVGGVRMLNFCDGSGVLFFDGIGMVTVTVTQKCSVRAPSGTGPLYYKVVDPISGIYWVDETPAFTDPSQVRLVEKGRTLLIDGTTRTNPDVFIFHGVAMRR